MCSYLYLNKTINAISQKKNKILCSWLDQLEKTRPVSGHVAARNTIYCPTLTPVLPPAALPRCKVRTISGFDMRRRRKTLTYLLTTRSPDDEARSADGAGTSATDASKSEIYVHRSVSQKRLVDHRGTTRTTHTHTHTHTTV